MAKIKTWKQLCETLSKHGVEVTSVKKMSGGHSVGKHFVPPEYEVILSVLSCVGTEYIMPIRCYDHLSAGVPHVWDFARLFHDKAQFFNVDGYAIELFHLWSKMEQAEKRLEGAIKEAESVSKQLLKADKAVYHASCPGDWRLLEEH